MFRSAREEGAKAWIPLEFLTFLYPYKNFQKKVVYAFSSSKKSISQYSKKTNRNVRFISAYYLEKHPEIAQQNVTLLKNAIELWNTAYTTSDAIAPLLFHYSWHCLNSFFIYTLFRWEPEHANSHGVAIRLKDNLEDIEINFLNRGIFQRIIDTYTLLGIPLAFSPFLPIFEDNRLVFETNNRCLVDESKSLSIKKLLEFDCKIFEMSIYDQRSKENSGYSFVLNSIYLPNLALKSYLILFAVSSFARYRPILWQSILTGENKQKTNLAVAYTTALLNFTIGEETNGGLLFQIQRLFREIRDGRFTLKGSTKPGLISPIYRSINRFEFSQEK